MLGKSFPFLIGLFTIVIIANSQTIINVPFNYSTIQTALNNAILNMYSLTCLIRVGD